MEQEQEKRDRLIAEWILRIATLEKLLLSKGIITNQELAKSYADSIAKMTEFMKIVLANEDIKDEFVKVIQTQKEIQNT